MEIAFLGTGIMGFPMAKRLLEFGYKLTVYNRTKSKTEELKKLGAYVADSPSETISKTECIMMMLYDARAIEEVLFSSEVSSLNNKTIIQMGTILPNESIEIQKKVFKYDGEYFECPVLGNKNDAAEGKLILMVGATKEKFEKWKILLKVFSKEPYYIGEVGKASVMKLVFNQLILSHAVSFSSGLGLIVKSNIDVDIFSDILRGSSLYAKMYDKKLQRWIKRDYNNPNFPIKHFLKDTDLILKELKNQNISSRVIEAAKDMLIKAVDKGLKEKDYSSIYDAINNL